MLGNRSVAAAALLASIVATTCQAYAWGAAGHAVVAEIAQRRLDPAAKRKVAELLGGDVSLASISNWADTLAMTKPQTRRWHYVNIPVGADGYNAARDCRETAQGDCIVAAIARARGTLADPAAPAKCRGEALKLLVHLIADLHQPLHTAERKGDGGGSLMPVTFFGSPTTLHLVWDFGVLDKAGYDWGEHVRKVTERLTEIGGASAAEGEPEQWAWETHRVAADVVYGGLKGTVLGEEYQAESLPVVYRQLGLAGLRLAHLLNETLLKPELKVPASTVPPSRQRCPLS